MVEDTCVTKGSTIPPQPTSRREPRPSRLHESPPDPWPDWRRDLLSTSGLTALGGLWLIVAPFALSYSADDPFWNDVACGTLIAAIAFIRLGGAARVSALSRLNAVLALWIFASAFWLDDSHRAASNDIAVGIIVVSLSLASAAATDRASKP